MRSAASGQPLITIVGDAPDGLLVDVESSGNAAVRIVVDPDAFAIDASQPFEFEYGSGSGLAGLKIWHRSENGTVRFFCGDFEACRDGDGWISSDIAQPTVFAAIRQTRFEHLAAAYAADVCDGWQAILWIRQGTRERTIYFDNAAPAIPLLASLHALPIRHDAAPPGQPTAEAVAAVHALWQRTRGRAHKS